MDAWVINNLDVIYCNNSRHSDYCKQELGIQLKFEPNSFWTIKPLGPLAEGGRQAAQAALPIIEALAILILSVLTTVKP